MVDSNFVQQALLATTAKEVAETEHHLHNRERWFGLAGTPSATHGGDEATLLPYQATSGNADFGTEILLLGIDDTPAISGMTRFDAHRLMVEAASNANPFIIRLITGSDTVGAAEAAGDYTDFMITDARKGSPVDIIDTRGYCNVDKVWLKVMNATNGATIDFFIGIHEYEV
jgi:hypothetical protein